MVTRHTTDLEKNFRRLWMETLSLLHFGQCMIFICNKVFPKIRIMRQKL